MNKYRNRKVKRDGMVFDSVKEYNRWKKLKWLEEIGEIYDLRRQVKYVLIPTQYSDTELTKSGRPKVVEREVTYIADFVYKDAEYGVEIVEDVKGVKTQEYILKRKMMLYLKGIRIMEV